MKGKLTIYTLALTLVWIACGTPSTKDADPLPSNSTKDSAGIIPAFTANTITIPVLYFTKKHLSDWADIQKFRKSSVLFTHTLDVPSLTFGSIGYFIEEKGNKKYGFSKDDGPQLILESISGSKKPLLYSGIIPLIISDVIIPRNLVEQILGNDQSQYDIVIMVPKTDDTLPPPQSMKYLIWEIYMGNLVENVNSMTEDNNTLTKTYSISTTSIGKANPVPPYPADMIEP